LEELRHAAGTGGIGLECPGDERCPFRIKVDAAALNAITSHDDVPVPQGSPVAGTAALSLLAGALLDLAGQVGAVELGDRGHYAVKQHSGWRLIDALGGGYQLGPCRTESQTDADIVGTVPGQPVNFVDDDVVDATVGDTSEHVLETGSV